MRAQEIRARLAALREAGAKLRRRPADETVNALAHVLDGWSDPRSPWRQALEEGLPGVTGFSPETVREGLARGLAGWNGDALRALLERELGPVARLDGSLPPFVSGFDVTAVVLAGCIPMPSLLALLAPLVLRSPVLVKSASRDPLTPRLVARSVAEVDAELGQCLELVAFPGADPACSGALMQADCISAAGSDETIASLRARIGPSQRFVGYGHRLSLALLGPAACSAARLPDVAERLALDVALWDQLGCLSPLAVFAVGDGNVLPVAEALALALDTVASRLPRGDVEPRVAAEIAHERAEAELRAAAGQPVAVLASPGSEWTVVREANAEPRPAPLHRFLRVHPIRHTGELPRALAPYAAHLAAVALEGFGSETDRLARDLASWGASRICTPGGMQSPPLGWHHDGQGVLAPLARFADVELRT